MTRISRIGIGYKKLTRNVASFHQKAAMLEDQEEMDSLKSIGGSSIFDETESGKN